MLKATILVLGFLFGSGFNTAFAVKQVDLSAQLENEADRTRFERGGALRCDLEESSSFGRAVLLFTRFWFQSVDHGVLKRDYYAAVFVVRPGYEAARRVIKSLSSKKSYVIRNIWDIREGVFAMDHLEEEPVEFSIKLHSARVATVTLKNLIKNKAETVTCAYLH